MALNGFRRPKRIPSEGNLIAALDVGTTKTCCLIARIEDGQPRIVGIGHQGSRGIRNGTIIDLDAAEVAIGSAVHAAEQMAGDTIRSVLATLCGGQPSSQNISIEVPVGGDTITDSDVARTHSQAHSQYDPDDSELIHAIPVGYTVDGSRGIRDPRGMYASRLGAQMHLITAAIGTVRNLSSCVHRCHLDIDGFVVPPYASGLACLVEDEMDLGVTVIDMGGGTTTMSIFSEGHVVHTDGVPVGGSHVTNDIARGLTTSVAYAERLKTLYGHVLPSVSDDRETINVPLVGEDDPTQANQVPKAVLLSIIRPRLEELFEMVRARLDDSGFARAAGRRVVLTGGASQLPGVRELAQLILDKQVRLGRPLRVAGLTEETSGPAFSTAAGLLLYAAQQHVTASAVPAVEATGNVLGRLGLWLRENL